MPRVKFHNMQSTTTCLSGELNLKGIQITLDGVSATSSQYIGGDGAWHMFVDTDDQSATEVPINNTNFNIASGDDVQTAIDVIDDKVFSLCNTVSSLSADEWVTEIGSSDNSLNVSSIEANDFDLTVNISPLSSNILTQDASGGLLVEKECCIASEIELDDDTLDVVSGDEVQTAIESIDDKLFSICTTMSANSADNWVTNLTSSNSSIGISSIDGNDFDITLEAGSGIELNGNEINVCLSETSGNLLQFDGDCLYVSASEVCLSETSGNLLKYDNGCLYASASPGICITETVTLNAGASAFEIPFNPTIPSGSNIVSTDYWVCSPNDCHTTYNVCPTTSGFNLTLGSPVESAGDFEFGYKVLYDRDLETVLLSAESLGGEGNTSSVTRTDASGTTPSQITHDDGDSTSLSFCEGPDEIILRKECNGSEISDDGLTSLNEVRLEPSNAGKHRVVIVAKERPISIVARTANTQFDYNVISNPTSILPIKSASLTVNNPSNCETMQTLFVIQYGSAGVTNNFQDPTAPFPPAYVVTEYNNNGVGWVFNADHGMNSGAARPDPGHWDGNGAFGSSVQTIIAIIPPGGSHTLSARAMTGRAGTILANCNFFSDNINIAAYAST